MVTARRYNDYFYIVTDGNYEIMVKDFEEAVKVVSKDRVFNLLKKLGIRKVMPHFHDVFTDGMLEPNTIYPFANIFEDRSFPKGFKKVRKPVIISVNVPEYPPVFDGCEVSMGFLNYFDVVVVRNTGFYNVLWAHRFDYNIILSLDFTHMEHDDVLDYLEMFARYSSYVKKGMLKVRYYYSKKLRNVPYTCGESARLKYTLNDMAIKIGEDDIEVAIPIIRVKSKCVADYKNRVYRVAPREFEVELNDLRIYFKVDSSSRTAEIYGARVRDARIYLDGEKYPHPNVNDTRVCLGSLMRIHVNDVKNLDEIAKAVVKRVVEVLSCPSTSAYNECFFATLLGDKEVDDLPAMDSWKI